MTSDWALDVVSSRPATSPLFRGEVGLSGPGEGSAHVRLTKTFLHTDHPGVNVEQGMANAEVLFGVSDRATIFAVLQRLHDDGSIWAMDENGYGLETFPGNPALAWFSMTDSGREVQTLLR